MKYLQKRFFDVKRVLAVAVLCLYSILGGFAQIDTVFWFAAPDLEINHQQTPVQFCFTTYNSAATITVEQPTNSAFPTATFTVPADSFYVLDVSNWVEDIESKPANTVLNRGFHISSTAFISCYYESVGNNSEMYTLKGLSGLGTDFLVPMQVAFNSNYSSSTSSIEIIATEDNTVVQITAPVALQGGIAAGSTVSVTLQRGQSYVVRSANTAAASHLHNTVIHSNKPIVVNSTDDSVASGQGCVDLIGEQLVPVNMTGRRYVAIRNYSSYSDNFERVFVFPLQNNTTVWFNGVPQTVSQGNFIDHLLTDTATLITSNLPISVFQITATGCEQGGTMLPHLECTGSYSVSHLRPNISSMIVTLVTENLHTGNFTLNGNPNAITAADFHPLAADPTLSYCLKDISNIVPTGTVMTLTNSSGRFQLGILDGDGTGSCSYGFFSDYARSSYIRFEMDSLYCVGDSILFQYSAPNVDSLVFTGPNGVHLTTPPFVFPNASISMSGWYYLNGVDTSSCFTILSDSIYIQVVPVSDDTMHISVETCDSYNWYGTTYTQTGNYTHSTVTSGGCIGIEMLHLTILPPPTILHTPDTTIQAGDSATLWASGADVLYWSDASGNILASGPFLTVSPTTSTMYYVTGQNMNADLNGNLVVNGDFEQGNVDFTSTYIYSSDLWPNGYYYVGPNAHNYHPHFCDWLDHTTGSGNYMIINGAETPNTTIWSQTVPVIPNTDYAFSTWVCSVTPGEFAQLQFSVNGVQLGNIFTAPNTCGIWSQYYEVWNSGNNTSATLTILNQNTAGGGNDFGLDDIVFAPLTECIATDSVLVHIPEFPDNVDSADCTVASIGHDWGIALDWSSTEMVSPLVIPLVGDIDGDHIPEIICFAPNDNYNFFGATQVMVFNSLTHQLIHTINLPDRISTTDASPYGIIKLPNGHVIIVVVMLNQMMQAYDLSAMGTSPLWSVNTDYQAPNVGFTDFNIDGYPEIYIGNTIYDAETGTLLIHDPTITNAGSSYSVNSAPGGQPKLVSPFVADLVGDNKPDLILGNEIYEVMITNRYGLAGNSITLSKSITPPSGIPVDGHPQVADFNLDGHLDVFISNKDNPNSATVGCYVWDVHSNTVSNALIIQTNTNCYGKSIPLIADVDNDDALEIVIQCNAATGNKVKCYKFNASTYSFDYLWDIYVDEDSYSNSTSAFDFNNDGEKELLISDQTTVRIVNGSGHSHLTGNDTIPVYVLTSLTFGECTVMQYPVVADVDADGSAELLVLGRFGSGHTYQAYLNVFKSASTPWAPARKVWNQYMYNVTNINENLTVPPFLFNNATPFTDPQGVVRRPYNNFLQQATTIDQYGRPFYAVPDVAMNPAASAQIIGDSLSITFSYCNLGDNTLNAPYPVTVFINSYGGDTLCTSLVNNSLPEDSCAQGIIRLPLNALCGLPIVDSFVIAVNCAGNGIAQNGNLQPECDTTNNTANITIHIEPETDSTHISVQACDSLTWNGIPYDSTGVYVQTLANMYGCDSVVVMSLTVNPTHLTEYADSVCQNMAYSGYGFSLSEDETGESGINVFDRTLTNQFGCDSVIRLNMYVKPVITPVFFANPDKAMLSENPVIHFVNTTNTVELAQADYYWIWNFGDGTSDTTSESNTDHLYTQWGDYTVTLSLWADGCVDSASVTVFIEADLEFPNVITPNGDGINDVFIIKNLNPDRPNKLYITDRWGKTVWNQKNYQTYMKDEQIYNAENGFGTGNISDGVYYFTFYYEGMVRTVKFNGSITVIR